jgi:glucose-1-phosphate adenylyltransferase
MASGMGVAEVDEEYRIHGFQEKPKNNPKTIPGDPNRVLASMGIYLFNTETLFDALTSIGKDDFGRDIIPRLIPEARVYAYPFRQHNVIEDYIYDTMENGEGRLTLESRTRDSSYWRDVGTLDAYWNANMDLTGLNPSFNLYGRNWPIHTYQVPAPPAKFVFSNERPDGLQVGKALDSLVAPGALISGIVRNSVLSYHVVVQSWATVEESVIMDDVVVGRHSKIKKAIIDKHNIIPAYSKIGYNPKEDSKRFTVTPRGIVVVPKGYFQ